MSEENVEIVRRFVDDFRAGKFEFDSEGMLAKMPGEERWHPDIEWEAPGADDAGGGLPDIGGTYRGIESARGFWREWLAAWETVQFEYELIDAGNRVVMLLDQRMRGRSTGIEVSMGRYAQVFTFRDGLLIHWKAYLSQAEALEAVGLRE